MIYLKYFESDAQYESYLNSEDFIEPNVSFVEISDKKHYNPRKFDIYPTVSINGWTYGSTPNDPTVSGNTGNGAVTYYYKLSSASSWSTTKPTNAGSYDIRADIAETEKYHSGTCSSTFTIAKVTPTVTAPTANNLTYNGSSQALITAGSTNLGTLKYSLDGSSYSTSIPSGTNASSYTVYYKVEGDSNINDVAPATVSATISAKQVTPTIELSQSTYEYNGSACEPTVTVKDGSTVISSNEYTVTYTNNVNTGTATVTISDAVGGNYQVANASTNFTINKGSRTISFDSSTLSILLGKQKTISATVSAGADDGTITYSSSDSTVASINGDVVSGVSTGSCTITATISQGNNYLSATTSCTLTVVDSIVLTCVYNAENSGSGSGSGSGGDGYTIKILDNSDGIESMMVDGAQEEVSTSHTFSTSGSHTVEFVLSDDAISEDIFNGCTNLSSCTIGSGVTSIGGEAFNGCSSLTSITIPNSVTSIGSSAFEYCTGLTSVIIGSGVTSIGGEAFNGCSSLTSITIPNSVTSIGSSAFYNCDSLTSVIIGSGVTSIGNSAFYNCTSLTSITIPNSVTSIGSSAFYNCDSLTSCTIGSGVTYIGGEAFRGCSSLTSITIPDSVTSIGTYAFNYCTSLTSINIPSGVTSIGTCVFYNCTGLTSIDIPSGVTNIGDSAFRYCSSLTSVTIPDSVTSIDDSAFDGCTSLTSCTIGSGVTSIGIGAFADCRNLTSVTIPDSVTSIGRNTFEGCRSLTSCTIGSGVTSIGISAFYGCSGLTSITIEATTPPPLVNGSSVFANTNNCPIYVTCSSVNAYKSASGWSDYTSRIQAIPGSCPLITAKYNVTSTSNPTQIGYKQYTSGFSAIEIDGVEQPSVVSAYTFSTTGEHTVKYYLKNTNINDYVFSGCTSLTSIDIPSGVTSIGSSAFKNCSSLTSIDIPSGVTSIGCSAFQNCYSLTSMTVDSNNAVYDSRSNCNAIIKTSTNTLVGGCKNTIIPNSVTSIGDGAFYGCSGLTSIDIPSGVTSIGSSAFKNCSSLTSIDIPSGVTSIDNSAFYGCSGLTSIDIPSGVTSINAYAFQNCYSLTSIVIPDSVTSIGVMAFYGCSGLTSIDIPSGVTSIGEIAFYNCRSLTSIDIPSGVTSINGSTFQYCSGLTSVTIPNSVTSIGNWAFGGCTSLTSVTIPDSVTIIVSSAFSSCSGLTSVTIGSGVTNIAYEAFQNCYSLTSIDIPDSVTSIGDYAFYGCSGLTSITSNATTAPTIQSNTFRNVKTGGTLYVPSGSSGYNTWMSTSVYYLGLYNWTKVEQ